MVNQKTLGCRVAARLGGRRLLLIPVWLGLATALGLVLDPAGSQARSPSGTQVPLQDEVPGDLIFPQFANGEAGGMRNASRVVLRNNNQQTVTGRIRFRRNMPNGPAPFMQIPVNGQMMDSIPFSLPPWGTFDIETDGTGELHTGSVEVFVDTGPKSLEGTQIFSILGNYVSVPRSRPQRSQQIYVSVNGQERTGIAAFNPDSESSANLNLILLNDAGNQRASRQITLQPKQHLARFVDEEELFRTYFAGLGEPFSGTLNIHVLEGEDVAVVGLIQIISTGALISTGSSSDAFGAPGDGDPDPVDPY